MKTKLFLMGCLLFSGLMSAKDDAKCALTIAGNDQMQFDQKSLTLDTSCKSIKLTLTHSGKLPKAAMGHNILFVAKADMMPIVKEAAAASASDYVPKNAKIIASSKLIGGGEKTEMSLDPTKFKKGTDYVFFCSFPGHFGMMQGTVVLK